MRANDITSNQMFQACLVTVGNSNSILCGGYIEDATFVLTGKESQFYYDYDKPYELNYEDLYKGTASLVPNRNSNNKPAASTVSDHVTAQSGAEKMPVKIMLDQRDGKSDYAVSATFNTVHSDGTKGGHAFTVVSVTSDTVTILNPWFSENNKNKTITMSRKEFLQCCKGFLLLKSVNRQKKADSKIFGIL